jgi:hypothetical protein
MPIAKLKYLVANGDRKFRALSTDIEQYKNILRMNYGTILKIFLMLNAPFQLGLTALVNTLLRLTWFLFCDQAIICCLYTFSCLTALSSSSTTLVTISGLILQVSLC